MHARRENCAWQQNKWKAADSSAHRQAEALGLQGKKRDATSMWNPRDVYKS